MEVANESSRALARRMILIAALFFAAIAPTLTWMQFSNGIENLNIETALEIRRGSGWLIPTLMSEPRVRKPPLTAWITAIAINPKTVTNMSSSDPSTRENAWNQLAWQTRWPALLTACITLAFACELGTILIGHPGGILSAMIAGTTLLFLRYARVSATDVHLALWVTIANVCFARFIFEKQKWIGLLGAGVAIGFGMMSKGPVMLVLTIVPTTIFILIYRRDVLRSAAIPAVIAILLAIVVGGWWFIYVFSRNPGLQKLWLMEVFRTDPSEAATSKWYDYYMLIPLLAPWIFFFVAGVVIIFRRADQRMIYALMLIVVPLVFMSFLRDRKVRYLYPMCVPCGIVAAIALRDVLVEGAKNLCQKIVVWGHWLLLGCYAIGLPICGMLGVGGMVRAGGLPWYSATLAICAMIIAAIVLLLSIVWHRRQRIAILVATLFIILGMHPLYIFGASRGSGGDGASEMLPLAKLLWREYPDAIAYDIGDGRKRIPSDLAIYLNRPIRQAKTIAGIPREPHPQIYETLQRRGSPDPAPAPGWRLLGKFPRDRDWHVVFIRE
jgi:4-amino-4-deoxy-L-arabinose transferase-like glycosyltransferase